MKLNLEIIRTYLPDSETLKFYGIETRKLIFSRPVLYEQGMPLLPGKLYVLHARDLPRGGPVAGTGIICVGDRMPSAWFTGGAQVLWIPAEQSVLRIFNQIRENRKRVARKDFVGVSLIDNRVRLNLALFIIIDIGEVFRF